MSEIIIMIIITQITSILWCNKSAEDIITKGNLSSAKQ